MLSNWRRHGVFRCITVNKPAVPSPRRSGGMRLGNGKRERGVRQQPQRDARVVSSLLLRGLALDALLEDVARRNDGLLRPCGSVTSSLSAPCPRFKGRYLATSVPSTLKY
jgi:hypothetical protein